MKPEIRPQEKLFKAFLLKHKQEVLEVSIVTSS